MKCSITGLLRLAQRHLAILDRLNNGEIDLSDLENLIEVNSCEEILSELIENIEIVQADQSEIDEFLRVYCIKKTVFTS